jgi:hypothetical protein
MAHGRNLRLFQLVDSHGVHHRLQQPVGDRIARMRGTIAKTRKLVWGGILTLIISTMVIGYGN